MATLVTCSGRPAQDGANREAIARCLAAEVDGGITLLGGGRVDDQDRLRGGDDRVWRV